MQYRRYRHPFDLCSDKFEIVFSDRPRCVFSGIPDEFRVNPYRILHFPQTTPSDGRLNSYRPPTKKSLTTLMTLKPLMILERAGNSPALTALCLPLSTDLKVFKDFNDPNDLKVPLLSKQSAQTYRSARTRRNPAKNSIRSRLSPKSRNPLFYRRNCSNSLPIYTH